MLTQQCRLEESHEAVATNGTPTFFVNGVGHDDH